MNEINEITSKSPTSRQLFSKKNPNKNPLSTNVLISRKNNPNKRNNRITSVSDLNDHLLITESDSRRDRMPFIVKALDYDVYNIDYQKKYLNEKLTQLNLPPSIIKGASIGLDETMHRIETDIVNEQLVLSNITKSVTDLIQKEPIEDEVHKTLPKESIKTIKNLKNAESKIKKNLLNLNQNEQNLEKEGYHNVSKSLISLNIRNDQLKEIKMKKETLYEKLDEINHRVVKIIDDNKPLKRKDNIQHFLHTYANDQDDYPIKRQKLEQQSILLKEKRLTDLSIAQDKRKKKLEQIEKESIEKKERFLTHHHDKEIEIVRKRKGEIDNQLNKTKQYINDQLTKKEKDYRYHIYKEKYELEQRKLFDKIRMQKKDELVSQEELDDLNRKLRDNKREMEIESIEKANIMREMWKNRSQVLPSFKCHLIEVIQEEQKKKMEEEEQALLLKEQFLQDAIVFAKEKIPKPSINKKLKKERENRIVRLTKKRNKKYKKRLRPIPIIQVPVPTKKSLSELPQFTKPLHPLPKAPNYLVELKKKREMSNSPIRKEDFNKVLNDDRGTMLENVEMLKINTEILDNKVQEKKKLMHANGGYSKLPDLGDTIGDLMIDSIKAKLMIINKLKGKQLSLEEL